MIALEHRKLYKAAGALLLILAVVLMIFCIRTDSKKSGIYPGNDTGITLCINEVLYSNLGFLRDEDGDNSDWIELYNYGDEAVSLNGLSIADSASSKNRWFFPDIKLEAGEYLLVWASAKNKVTDSGELHTDFFISPTDNITLYDRDMNCIDEFYFTGSVDVGNSVGRTVKDTTVLAQLSNSTPLAANSAMPVSYVMRFDKSLAAPEFSEDAGIYDSEFDLELSAEEGLTILYTLDGSDPDLDSKIYTEPIHIRDRSDEPAAIGNTKTTPNYQMNYSWENTYTYKGTVVKARTAKNGVLSDEIVTRSYFISPKTSFTIASLSTDPSKLFDEWKGLYVPGETYYVWKKYNKESTNNVFPPANYYSTNKVKAHLEIFDNKGESLADSNVEVGIMGAASRSSAAKSLKVTIDENRKAFDTDILSLLESAEGDIDDGMDQLMLRPSGTDFNRTMFCDMLSQSIVADKLNVTYLDGEAAVLFIDGEYWGIHNIREVYGADYFYRHFGIDRKNLALITLNTGVSPYVPEINEGTQEDLDDYLALVEFVNTHDLSEEENYSYVADRIDVDNFIDYYIAEMYFGNDDWPGNNFRVWRADQKSSAYGDNRWRIALYDIDDGFLYPEFNSIEYVLTKDYDKEILKGVNLHYDDNREIIIALMTNDEFKTRFFDRFEECLDTVFASDNVIEQIDAYASFYETEMKSHFSRWHTVDGWLKKIKNLIKYTYSEKDLYTYDRWLTKVEAMRTFAKERPDNLREYIRQYNSK